MQPKHPNKYQWHEQDWLESHYSHTMHIQQPNFYAVLVGQEPCSDAAGFVAVSPGLLFF